MKLIRSLGIGNSRPAFLLILTIVMMLALSLSAAAQNQYYVSTSGSDSNNGTSPSTPWRTCSHAISSFTLGSGGAVVNFAPGNYGAVCTVNRGGSSPTVRLVLKCTAQWTAGGSTGCRGLGWLVTSANNVDIGAIDQYGFEYTDPNAQVGVDVSWQCGTAGTCASGNGIHVLGNYLHDIGQNASGEGVGCPYSGAILAPTGHGHTISGFQAIGNLIDHFGANGGSSCAAAHGIYIASAGGTVQNNIITRAAASALQYYDQACNASISNNVLAASRFGLIVYGGNGCTPGLNTITNNIIVNNSSAGVYTGYSGPSVCSSGLPTLFSNNDLFGNGTDFNNPAASCETRRNQLSENPTATFVNYTGTATGNYHLKSSSVAVGGGTTQCTPGGTNLCAPALDFSASARTGTPSLGIFEAQGDTSASAPSAPSGLTASVQ
ncbi:MAG: right-handed parallel beta-helix repeat-containing protein [Terriglobales bacterium]